MARLWKFAGRGLSVCQPWAAAIAYVGKDVENKPLRTHYRGPVAIHASQTVWWDDLNRYKTPIRGGPKMRMRHWIRKGQQRLGFELDCECEIMQGHILAIAMIVDCVESSSSRWFNKGSFGWVLRGVVPTEPIEMSGKLGLWNCRFEYEPLV